MTRQQARWWAREAAAILLEREADQARPSPDEPYKAAQVKALRDLAKEMRQRSNTTGRKE